MGKNCIWHFWLGSSSLYQKFAALSLTESLKCRKRMPGKMFFLSISSRIRNYLIKNFILGCWWLLQTYLVHSPSLKPSVFVVWCGGGGCGVCVCRVCMSLAKARVGRIEWKYLFCYPHKIKISWKSFRIFLKLGREKKRFWEFVSLDKCFSLSLSPSITLLCFHCASRKYNTGLYRLFKQAKWVMCFHATGLTFKNLIKWKLKLHGKINP